MARAHETRTCIVCGKWFPKREVFPLAAVRPTVVEEIVWREELGDRSKSVRNDG